MSTQAVVAKSKLANAAVTAQKAGERRHHMRLVSGYVVAIALILGLAIYGFNYYTLNSVDRPFSAKHALLRPSGTIGEKLGFLGFTMFLCIFLYPLHKRWAWLGQQGSARHWLDIHVLLGLSAPFIIAFHASFKFRGFAGIAFWIMVAVSLSGVIGRYLYGQIPRSLNAAELSLKELQEMRDRLSQQLAEQHLLPEADLRSLLRLPSRDRVQRLPMVIALIYMMGLDLVAHISHSLGLAAERWALRRTDSDLRRISEDPPSAIWKKRSRPLAKRPPWRNAFYFSARAQQVFHLVARGAQALQLFVCVLALIHIGVVMAMGFF